VTNLHEILKITYIMYNWMRIINM